MKKEIMLIQIILFLTSSYLIACKKEAAFNTTVVSPSSSSNNYIDTTYKTYLALGDSYTIGQSVSEPDRFPAQTVSRLMQSGIFFKSPEYIATTGWTTIQLLNAINTANLKNSYNLVTLLIGVNDQYQHLDTGGYRIRFKQLLEKSIALAGNIKTHVFVLSIPDYSVTPFGGNSNRISKEIDAFNAINKEITLAYQVSYIDITPLSKKAATDSTLIANDGLHPSAKQYTLWVDLLAPEVYKVFK